MWFWREIRNWIAHCIFSVHFLFWKMALPPISSVAPVVLDKEILAIVMKALSKMLIAIADGGPFFQAFL